MMFDFSNIVIKNTPSKLLMTSILNSHNIIKAIAVSITLSAIPFYAIADTKSNPKNHNIETADSVKTKNLDEFFVYGSGADRNRLSVETGKLTLTDEMILNLPMIFAEPDVVKSLQTLPGVSMGVEGFSSLLVRGGDDDQNLFILQGIPLYHVSHLGGIFSSFNVAAIDKVDFYKGSFPARYGGRTSSVVDIRMKNPDFNRYHGKLSVGLLCANIYVTGPVIKDRSAFSFSARRTWAELVTIPAIAIMNSIDKEKGKKHMAGYGFTDLNLRLDHRFNNNASATIAGYFGHDNLRLGLRETHTKGDISFKHILAMSTKYIAPYIKAAVAMAMMLTTTACYHEIDLDEYRRQEGADLLTINCIISADSLVRASATKTFFYSDIHNKRENIADLKLKLFVNDEFKEDMRFNSYRGLYISNYKAKAGDRLELRTEYLGAEVSATDVMPAKTEITDFSAEYAGPIQIYQKDDYVFTYHISFTDEPDTENFYFLTWKNIDPIYGVTYGTPVFSQEPVFQILAENVRKQIPGWEPFDVKGLPFSDKGIDGKQYTLTVKEIITSQNQDIIYRSNMKRQFLLFSISKEYYSFLVSILGHNTENDDLQGGMIDLGLVEPVKFYSNITNGVGIIGCCNPAVFETDIFKIVPGWPEIEDDDPIEWPEWSNRP